jgi:hypothetical protein
MILYTYYDSINIITIIVEKTLTHLLNLKSASNLNGNLNCSKELEHYAS